MHRQQGINPFVQHFCLFIFSPFFFFTDKHQMANVLFLVRKKKKNAFARTRPDLSRNGNCLLFCWEGSTAKTDCLRFLRKGKLNILPLWGDKAVPQDTIIITTVCFIVFVLFCFFKSFYLLSHAWSDWSYSLVLLLTQSHHLIIFWKVIQRRTCTLKP